MFGRGRAAKSSNDRFVMAAGRAAGNLRGAAGPPFNKAKALAAPLKPAASDKKKPVSGSPVLKVRPTNRHANINKRAP